MRTGATTGGFLAGVSLTLVLLAACTSPGTSSGAPVDHAASSGSGGPTARPVPSAGPSVAGSEAEAARSAVPEPPTGPNDRAGRTAFARYVLQAWVYALNHNDPEPLLAVTAGGTCGGCDALVEELSTRERENWAVVLPAVQVGEARRQSGNNGSGGTSRVALTVDIPASTTVFADGRVRSRTTAHPDTLFVVELRRTREAFVLVSFGVR